MLPDAYACNERGYALALGIAERTTNSNERTDGVVEMGRAGSSRHVSREETNEGVNGDSDCGETELSEETGAERYNRTELQ